VIAWVVIVASGVTVAHENHAPLPTKGVTIAGDTIMLSDRARESIGLTTAKVEFGDIHRILAVNARVELPWHAQAMITSLVSGRIDQVLVWPGATVDAGQELARLVSSELGALQLTLLQARAEIALARKLAEQRATLGRQGVIAQKELLEAEANSAEKSAALEIARRKLAALGLDDAAILEVEQQGLPLPYVSITSPINGVVTHADVRIGQVINPTEHLYHVVDLTSLWIVGEVLESDIRFLATGQQVEARFTALPNETFRGQIDHLTLTVDPKTRTQAVVIAVENESGRLLPGMFGRVRISVQVAKQAIVCPVDAVIRSRTGNHVLTQRMPGKYENRPVKLGLTENGRVEVLEGVFPGDQVVMEGNSLLAALLGNEHKARVETEQEKHVPQSQRGVIAVAHGVVELPTGRQFLAAPQVEGRIRRILVRPSQEVVRGDVLAEVESLQLRSIQLDLLQTITRARLAEKSLRRLEDLDEQGITPRRQIWETQSRVETLRLKADAIKSQLILLGLDSDAIERLEQMDLTKLDSTAKVVEAIPVRAPASGRIVSVSVVPGQVVRRDEALFEIHDLSRVWVKGYVYETDANRVRLGQQAHVRFTAYPDLEARGEVVRISPLMHENMRVMPVWVEVPNPDHRLQDGMFARMTILAEPARDTGREPPEGD
jgi:cobalt-zinc-cadmium efflux system membrane fusion protein